MIETPRSLLDDESRTDRSIFYNFHVILYHHYNGIHVGTREQRAARFQQTSNEVCFQGTDCLMLLKVRQEVNFVRCTISLGKLEMATGTWGIVKCSKYSRSFQ
jgi:hypothetical protein